MGWTIDIHNMPEEAITVFRNSDRTVEIGDSGVDVQILEQMLEEIEPKFYNGPPDDIFGKGVRKAVMRFQQARLLQETGAADPETRRTLVDAWCDCWKPGMVFKLPVGDTFVHTFGATHPILGSLPETVLGNVEGGRISNFGGPLDPGDRIYGQAYLRDASSPGDFLRRHGNLVGMGVAMTEAKMHTVTRFKCDEGHTWDGFPKDDICKKWIKKERRRCNLPGRAQGPVLKSLDEWPIVEDWRGKWKRADGSWCLDPDGCYCAIRRRPGQLGSAWRDANCPRVIVYNPETRKAAITLNTDYGPHPDTRKYVDVAPKVERHLGVKTGARVFVAWGLDKAPPMLVG